MTGADCVLSCHVPRVLKDAINIQCEISHLLKQILIAVKVGLQEEHCLWLRMCRVVKIRESDKVLGSLSVSKSQIPYHNHQRSYKLARNAVVMRGDGVEQEHDCEWSGRRLDQGLVKVGFAGNDAAVFVFEFSKLIQSLIIRLVIGATERGQQA